MAKYLLIESRDPWESGDVAGWWEVGKGLAAAGNQVTLFLIQNGVLTARAGVQPDLVSSVGAVRVLADDFSLRARGIGAESLAASVGVSDVDALVDLLADGAVKAIWH